jgi:release factor glutamine methyltransferase
MLVMREAMAVRDIHVPDASGPIDLRTDVRSLLRLARQQLRAANVPSADLAAELLLMRVLRRDRAWLYTYSDSRPSRDEAAHYAMLLAKRCAGVPTQYLTGQQEFWGMEFEVTPDVLIPRPETEHLVEVSLERIGARRAAPLCIADVGTGSGCVAVALAREVSAADIYATDISAAALTVARRNAERHGVAEQVHFALGNLLEPFFLDMTAGAKPEFDLIVSNPPYIARRDSETLPREVGEHEPPRALYGGDAGTEMYAPLFQQAKALLGAGGIIAVEIGFSALAAVREPLDSDAAWRDVAVNNDLAGIPRVVSAIRNSEY